MTSVMLSISEDEKTTLKNLMAALKPFRDLSERLPLSTVTAFIGVALKENRTMGEYAVDGGFALSIVSRLHADLGDVNRWGDPGYGLVESRVDLLDSRIRRTKLTPVGHALVGLIVRALERGPNVYAPCSFGPSTLTI
jgi:hypothetical protein